MQSKIYRPYCTGLNIEVLQGHHWFNTLRPRQNGRHFADDIFKCIFLNENVRILIKISLKVVPKGPINNIPSLVQIMAWRRPGDKPLAEPMMVSLLTHICVARPQWVNKWHDLPYLLSSNRIKHLDCISHGLFVFFCDVWWVFSYSIRCIRKMHVCFGIK